LIDKVLDEGPLTIATQYHLSENFNGYWSPEERTIYITPDSSHPFSTLLFELHNAVKNEEFRQLDLLAYKREISRKDYIQRQEFIEYQNALETSALLDKGMEEGLFPPNVGWYPAMTFKEHFQIQKSCGHSAWIGEAYDEMRGY
jgi:hypothetical protein